MQYRSGNEADPVRVLSLAGRGRRGAQRDRRRTPRILLLTSDLGSGHVRAAEAVGAAVLASAPHAVVRTLDFWDLMHPGVANAIRQIYLRLVQEHPDLYERIYQLDEHTWRDILESDAGPPAQVLEVLELIAAIRADGGPLEPRRGRYASDLLLYPLLAATLPANPSSLAGNGLRARLAVMKFAWLRLVRRMESYLSRYQPQVIVCTQMIPGALVSFVKRRRQIRTPSISVLTDFGVHDFWNQPFTDHYCLAHGAIDQTPLADVDPKRIWDSGVPLMPGFQNPPVPREARVELGLNEGTPVVLVLGGGLGLGLDATVKALLTMPRALQLLVVAGHNAAARASLMPLAQRHPERLKVFDWTNKMHVLMRAADVIVGKPGGATVAEALACGRPLLATRSLGGQENFNVRFLERHRIGRLIPDSQLLAHLAHWLDDPAALARMQTEAWALGRRDGARRVADVVLQQTHAHVASVPFEVT
jgi:UDP-N-acetylglucosamine:LPS N-acetylglucosamine transferase